MVEPTTPVEIYRTDGRIERHYIPRRGMLRWCREQIGAEVCDTVSLPGGRVMLVDDHGYESREEVRGNVTTLVPVRALKPVNANATALYHAVCKPGTTFEIVGDVAVIIDEHVP